MTDKIGSISLQRTLGFSNNGRTYTIAGDMADEDDVKELAEYVRDADNGGAIHRIPGGLAVAEDLSPDMRFTQLCAFEDESLPDGWYLIRVPMNRSEDTVVMFEFQMGLFYMGSALQYKYGLEVRALSSSTNDWGK